MERAVRFHQGDLNPRFFNWPSLYMYVMAGVYGLVFGASPRRRGRGVRPGSRALLPRRAASSRRCSAPPRSRSSISPAGLAYGRTVGILAAGFLAVDLLHVRDSHWVTTDVPLTFLITLATFYALRYWRDGRLADAGAAGLVAGPGRRP